MGMINMYVHIYVDHVIFNWVASEFSNTLTSLSTEKAV